jgi:hypothetical protein
VGVGITPLANATLELLFRTVVILSAAKDLLLFLAMRSKKQVLRCAQEDNAKKHAKLRKTVTEESCYLIPAPTSSRTLPVVFSTSACKLLPCESMVTSAIRSLTRKCHMASGMPSSSSDTSSTF